MAWDDDDLQNWIDYNLGYGTTQREQKIQAYLDRQVWGRHRDELDGGDPNIHQRCSKCGLPRQPRHLNLQQVCYLCRDPQAQLEVKLKHYLWLLREMSKLRKTMKQFEGQHPDVVALLNKVTKGKS